MDPVRTTTIGVEVSLRTMKLFQIMRADRHTLARARMAVKPARGEEGNAEKKSIDPAKFAGSLTSGVRKKWCL